MLKRIFLQLFRPNHQPEMLIQSASSNGLFERRHGDEFAIELINRFWVNNNSTNDRQSKAVVKNVAEKMMEDCRKVLSSPNPVMDNRLLLAESVLRCAKLQVLVISPEPERDGSGLRGHLGITGELKAKILEVIKADNELDSFDTFSQGQSFDKAWTQMQHAYRRSWAYMNIFEGLRHEFDDINPEQYKDWFRPFFASQCAYAESCFREELGMPATLNKANAGEASLGAMYGNYREIVLSGDRFPDLTWEEKYPQLENPKIIWNET